MLKKICNSLVTVLTVLAVTNVYGPACSWLVHQPEVPKVLRK